MPFFSEHVMGTNSQKNSGPSFLLLVVLVPVCLAELTCCTLLLILSVLSRGQQRSVCKGLLLLLCGFDVITPRIYRSLAVTRRPEQQCTAAGKTESNVVLVDLYLEQLLGQLNRVDKCS